MKYLMNTPEFIPRRRDLRHNQTDAEKKLWQALRSRQFEGLKFRRQYSVGPYILDFYCPEKKLCIELDGGQHATNIDHDKQRSQYLTGLGMTVVRFWNNDVLKNIEGVTQTLTKLCQKN